MFTEKYPERVLLYQEQKLHKGADAALQQLAAQRQCEDTASQANSSAATVRCEPSAPAFAEPSQQPHGSDQPHFSQWQPRKLQDGYFSDFVLGLTRPELMQLLIQYGHNRHMSIDATHSTNRAKVCFALLHHQHMVSETLQKLMINYVTSTVAFVSPHIPFPSVYGSSSNSSPSSSLTTTRMGSLWRSSYANAAPLASSETAFLLCLKQQGNCSLISALALLAATMRTRRSVL